MFIQVITGKYSDADAFTRQGNKWEQDVRPGATGFLGSTSGITDDGRFIVIARFESEEAARANNDRPEQGAWWAETEKVVEGAEFRDSTDVITFLGGGKDNAGFVQVMRGRVTDPEKLAARRAVMGKFEAVMSEARPDVIGEVIAIHADGTYTDAVYFSSQEEARANETKPMPPEAEAMMGELMAAVTIDEYFDLSAPELR
jgi:hypothetical protein